MAASRGIPIVEDAAESFASRYRGRAAGAMGTIGTLSFQATKTITTGEGGMVLTTDPSLRDKMALYRSHGMIRQNRYYWHELPGHNFRLTNLQAALGCAQMERLDQIVAARKRVHFAYTKRLAGIQGVTPQVFTPDVDPVLWAMALRLDPGAYPQGRDTVIEQLKEAGMETRPGFYAPSLMPHLYSCPPLAVCEQLSREVLSLPTYPSLSDEDIERVCAALDRVRK
jgi:perosamine synthetase